MTTSLAPPFPLRTLSLSLSLSLCRIKYILRQSDIFATHFGVVLSDSEEEDDEEEEGRKGDRADGGGAAAAGGSPSKRRQAAGKGDAVDEIVDDVGGEDSAPTFLTKQPPSISGGTMRSYQLEGLNWMINLQAQGTNGERTRRSMLPPTSCLLLLVYA